MQLAFILTMPNRGSWNGGWSGEDRIYCILKSFTSKKDMEKADRLILKKNFHYSWSDGWGANVEVKLVDRAEAMRLRRRSQGFCGYDWMVKSILQYGTILADHEVEKFLESQKNKESQTCQHSQ